MESYGISQKRVARAIDELLAKGFIEIINPGGLYDKDKAIYGLTDDYRKWRPGDPPMRTRSRDVQRGYQGKKNVADADDCVIMYYHAPQDSGMFFTHVFHDPEGRNQYGNPADKCSSYYVY